MGKARYDAIRIAKQLCYSENVINKIKVATSESEITRILHTASHTKFVNENGEVISVPKSINRMLWQREVRKHNIVGVYKSEAD